MGFRNKVYITAIIVLTTLISILYSVLLLKNQDMAIAIYVVSMSLLIIFIHPFIGILNYFLFLYMRPQEFTTAFQNIPIILIVVSVTFAVMIVRAVLDKRKMVNSPQNIFMIWMYLAVMFSEMAQLYIGGVIKTATDFLHIVLSYFLIVNLIDNERKLKVSLYAIILLSIYLSIAGIVQYHMGSSFGIETVQAERRIRGLGIFGDPNDLAMALLIAMPFLILKIQSKVTKLMRSFMIGLLFILLYALYLTNSRGGMLAFMVLMGLIFVKRYGKKLGVALFLVGAAGLFALGPSRIAELSPHEASAYGRVESWAAGFGMFTTHPLFGVGKGAYTDYFILVAHNSFIHCAAELGLFGLFPWVALIFISMKNLLFVSRKLDSEPPSEMRLICNSLLYSMVMYVVTTIFLSRVYSELLYIYVAFSAACIRLYTDKSKAKYELMEHRDLLEIAAVILVGLIVLKVFLILYW
jgi:putative inorganic carbon (HCO3(-)) transporter